MARVASASPAMMAWPTPYSAHSVGWCDGSDDSGSLVCSRGGRGEQHEPGPNVLAAAREVMANRRPQLLAEAGHGGFQLRLHQRSRPRQ